MPETNPIRLARLAGLAADADGPDSPAGRWLIDTAETVAECLAETDNATAAAALAVADAEALATAALWTVAAELHLWNDDDARHWAAEYLARRPDDFGGIALAMVGPVAVRLAYALAAEQRTPPTLADALARILTDPDEPDDDDETDA
jgi:hypothetical protein